MAFIQFLLTSKRRQSARTYLDVLSLIFIEMLAHLDHVVLQAFVGRQEKRAYLIVQIHRPAHQTRPDLVRVFELFKCDAITTYFEYQAIIHNYELPGIGLSRTILKTGSDSVGNLYLISSEGH